MGIFDPNDVLNSFVSVNEDGIRVYPESDKNWTYEMSDNPVQYRDYNFVPIMCKGTPTPTRVPTASPSKEPTVSTPTLMPTIAPTGECPNFRLSEKCPISGQDNQDLIFLVDSSNTISDEDYELLMNSLKTAVEGGYPRNSRLGMVMFAGGPPEFQSPEYRIALGSVTGSTPETNIRPK
eukprot:UN34018